MQRQAIFNRAALAVLGAAIFAGSLGRLDLSATGQTPREPFIRPGLIDNEASAIEASTNNLMSFFELANDLKKKPNLSADETRRLSSSAENAKKAIQEYKRNLESFIAKLRAAGKWTGDYDTFVKEPILRAAPSEARTHLLESLGAQGGARSALTNMLSFLDRIYYDIDGIAAGRNSLRSSDPDACGKLCVSKAVNTSTACGAHDSSDNCYNRGLTVLEKCLHQCP
jgi:hypothetical protein